jgi:hypothetical protein
VVDQAGEGGQRGLGLRGRERVQGWVEGWVPCPL